MKVYKRVNILIKKIIFFNFDYGCNKQEGQMNFDDLNHENNYTPIKAYTQSKLCNLLFTHQLAKHLKGTNVTVNALHPGVIRTELGRNLSLSYGWMFKIVEFLFVPFYFWLFKSSKQGAQTTIYCAVSDTLSGVTGKYFSDCKEKQLRPFATNDRDAQRLWDMSEKLCGLN